MYWRLSRGRDASKTALIRRTKRSALAEGKLRERRLVVRSARHEEGDCNNHGRVDRNGVYPRLVDDHLIITGCRTASETKTNGNPAINPARPREARLGANSTRRVPGLSACRSKSGFTAKLLEWDDLSEPNRTQA